MGDHTPAPWTASAANFGQYSVGPADNVIAVTYSLGSNGRDASASANADFIVKAVNNHAALVKALQAALVIAKQEWDFPGAHPHRAAVVRDMEGALALLGCPSQREAASE